MVTDPEFVRVMATLKRDNGIISFYHDMFQLAKVNLEYARQYRPNDPAAHYYYGKVMKLVGLVQRKIARLPMTRSSGRSTSTTASGTTARTSTGRWR